MPINSNKYVNTDSQDTPIIRYVVVERPVSIKRYGVDITDILGEVDANGNLTRPTGRNVPDFSAITGSVGQAQLMGKFYNSAITGNVVLNATSIANYGCSWAFRQSDITGFECPRLTTCGANCFEYAFMDADVKVVKFDSLTDINNYGFNDAFMRSRLESASFNALEIIDKAEVFVSAFARTHITQNPFPKLKEISGGRVFSVAFGYCNDIETFAFDKLETITGNLALTYAFSHCSKLETLSFPAFKAVGTNTDIFNNMLDGCSGVTVHFPSNMQSVIGGWDDVSNGFGGTNTTVLFDLEPTE